MFTAEEIWCQLFSEPGSGSDLASLSTKAVDDGDGYIVNGQKVWTTLGHLAKWGLLVTRTDPNAPKHRGLTFFIFVSVKYTSLNSASPVICLNGLTSTPADSISTIKNT